MLDALDKFDREDAVPLASALLNKQFKARLLKPLRIQVAKAIADDKAKALLELSDSVADPDTLKDTKTLWKLVKFLAPPLDKKGGVRPLPGIRLADGTMAQTHEEIRARWQEHFAGIELGEIVAYEDMVARIRNARGISLLVESLHDLPSLIDTDLACLK